MGLLDTPTIKNIPRNKLSMLADLLQGAKDKTGAVGDFFLGQAPEVVNNMSYGFNPTRGQGMTYGMKPEAADLANIIPTAAIGGLLGKSYAKLAGKELARQVQGGTGLLGRNMPDPRMNIVKNPKMNVAAKEFYGTTPRPSETGFILDDGTRLDLSGRHEATGYTKFGDRYIAKKGEPDYLRGERAVDHRSAYELLNNGNYGWDGLSEFIDQTGAVRYTPDTGVSMVNTNKPSETQIQKIVDDFTNSRQPLLIDIDRKIDGQNLASKEFKKPNYDAIKKWLDAQYKKNGAK